MMLRSPRRAHPALSLLASCWPLVVPLSLGACSSDPATPAPPGGGSSSTAGATNTTGGMTSPGGTASAGASSAGTSNGPGGSGSGGGGVAGARAGAGAGTGGLSNGAGAGGTTPVGTGGSSGAAPTAGSGGGSSVGMLSDDFESGTGTTPDATKWSIFNGAATGQTPNTVAVSTEQAHSGTHSIKIDVKNAGAMLTTKVGLPPASGAIYFRAWARFGSGAASTATWQPHVTFVEAGGLLDNGDVDQSDEARLGGQAGKVAANLSQGDGLSPDPFKQPCTPCTDPPASDKWVCVEGLFDGKNKKMAAWIDGVQVVKADGPSDWHAASTYPAAFERIGFGWESYGSVANTVYYDDIVIGNERINCN